MEQTWPVAGEPPRSGCTASPLPSQGLRKRHRPSGEVQFAKTAPGPGGHRRASRGSSTASSTPGEGGEEREGREKGDDEAAAGEADTRAHSHTAMKW